MLWSPGSNIVESIKYFHDFHDWRLHKYFHDFHDWRLHSEEKSNKSNQCWYTSSQHTCNLRRHLKTHIGDYEYDGDNEDDEDDLTDVTVVSDDTY